MSLFGGKQPEERGALGTADGAASVSLGRESSETSRRPGRPTPRGGENGMANIGKSIAIKGDLTGNEDMTIEGKVEGKIELPNNQLTIGANGTVRAELLAKSVVVIGRVAGNIQGSERIEIQATGVVEGDVCAPKLVVAEGAVLNGAIQMGKSEGGTLTRPSDPPSPEVRKVG